MTIGIDHRNSVALIDEELYERRCRVLTLRMAGATFTQIAAKEQISVTTARKDHRLAMRELMAETHEERIGRYRATLRDLRTGCYAGMLNGDPAAAGVVLKALEREARLCGDDAPQRVAVGPTDMQFAEDVASLITSIAKIAPEELRELLPSAPIIDAETVEADAPPAQPVLDPPSPPPSPDTAAREDDDEDDGPWSNL